MRPRSDISILGAGVIGLTLALELRTRGHRVTVLERGIPLAQASTAAAGMLAVEDPHNPTELLPLARLSGSLYSAFLARVEELSGLSVPFQTEITLQTMPDGALRRLAEHSIDPRQLAPALLRAVNAVGVRVLGAPAERLGDDCSSLASIPGDVVYTAGAWGGTMLPVFPRKGQMLRVHLPSRLGFAEVYRSERVYVVPRRQGPQAGTALIGATVEDAGFDTATDPVALAGLRAMGGELVPALRKAAETPMVEAWAGLRPATQDGLPLLGEWTQGAHESAKRRRFVATGHFRNGILLAPATAVVMADLIEGRPPSIDLSAFASSRFEKTAAKLAL